MYTIFILYTIYIDEVDMTRYNMCFAEGEKNIK